ncbi:septal ring lytic transglycosylase RlpA family protein [soil metagenome]
MNGAALAPIRSGRGLLLAIGAMLLLVACGSAPKRAGGYYQNDGPPDRVPAEMSSTPDALPNVETIRSSNARPYTVLGRSYKPMTALGNYKQRGLASWYGKQFHGESTASGERYDMYAMTAAHKTLPIPSYARVTSVKSGKSVIVRINDRGPFHDDRIIDLSYAAAVRIGGPNVGTQLVDVELLMPDEIAQIRDARGRGDTAVAEAAPSAVAPAPLPAPVVVPSSAVTPVSTSVPASSAPAPATPPGTASIDAVPSASVVAIQVGAYSVRSNADAMVDRLSRDLPDLAARATVVMRDGLYRVRIGPYGDALQAIADQQRLRDRISEAALLVDAR